MTAPAGNEPGGEPTTTTPETRSNNAEFTPITSQDQFDQMFNTRWSREQAKIHDQYKGFDDLKAKADQFDQLQAANQTEAQRLQAAVDAANQKAADSEARLKAAELGATQQRVAIEEGLDPSFGPRLRGETEDELRADAKEMFTKFVQPATPPFDHGARNQSAPQSMNDLIFGAAKRR